MSISSRQKQKLREAAKGNSICLTTADNPDNTEAMNTLQPNGYVYLLDPCAVMVSVVPGFFEQAGWNNPPAIQSQRKELKGGGFSFNIACVRQSYPHFGTLYSGPLKISAELECMCFEGKKMPSITIIADMDINKLTGDTNRFHDLGIYFWEAGMKQAYHNAFKQ